MFTAHGMAVYHDKQYVGVKEVNWAVAVRDSSLIVYSKPVQKFTVVEYMPYDTAWTRSGIIGQWLCTDNDSILCVVAASVSEGKSYFWFIYKDYVFILGVSKGVPAQQPKKPTQQPEGNRV
jgi:hypothetical protein